MTLDRASHIGKDLFLELIKLDAFNGKSTSDITLRLDVAGRVYSKTMPFKDYQDEDRVAKKWSELFEILKKDLGVGNVPTSNNNPKEDDMSLQEKKEALFAAAEALVTEVSGIDTTPYSEEEMAAVKIQLATIEEALTKAKSDDEADKAAIEDGKQKLAAIVDFVGKLTAPKVEAPVEAAPIEETPVVEAQP